MIIWIAILLSSIITAAMIVETVMLWFSSGHKEQTMFKNKPDTFLITSDDFKIIEAEFNALRWKVTGITCIIVCCYAYAFPYMLTFILKVIAG